MAQLSINIDHLATLRQARLAQEPDLLAASALIEQAGADGITVHLREDRRHIQDNDVYMLRKNLKSLLNLEIAATKEMLAIAKDIKADSICLVPEKRLELTTEGGLDVTKQVEYLTVAIQDLQAMGTEVSLFIDPLEAQILAAKATGAKAIEIHTGKYCTLFQNQDAQAWALEYQNIKNIVELALNEGLKVNLGHGINYVNVKPLAQIKNITQFSIGHSIISRSCFVGIGQAVKEMVNLIGPG